MSDRHYEILRRINSRKAVEELFTFVPDVLLQFEKTGGVDDERFWDLLATEAAAKEGKVLVNDGERGPMSTAEAVKFEKEIIPNGVHKGKIVGDAPLDYFIYLVENDFSRKLRRYVQSALFKEKQ